MATTDEWRILRDRNQQNIMQILGELSDEEKLVFHEIIEFEQEHRHQHSPEFRAPLKRIVELNIRGATIGEE